MFGLCALVLALALVACGGGGDEEEEEGTPSGGQQATATAEKTSEATAKPSSGGGGETSLKDIPTYPGADKTGEFSGDYSLPLLGQELDVGEFGNTEWAVYETSDSVDDVANFYKDKMPDKGWNEENWFDTSTEDGGVAIGSYTRNDGDSAAWVYVGGDGDKTEIVIGTGSK